LHTTWNTIANLYGFWHLAYSAALCWGETVFNPLHVAYQGNELVAIMRKIDFPNGNYENSGLIKNQITEALPT